MGIGGDGARDMRVHSKFDLWRDRIVAVVNQFDPCWNISSYDINVVTYFRWFNTGGMLSQEVSLLMSQPVLDRVAVRVSFRLSKRTTAVESFAQRHKYLSTFIYE